jgi:hypothetical protein
MPPRRTSQRLHPDKGLPQTFDQNQIPFHHPPTQALPTITETVEHLTFDNIPEIQQQSANMSTTAAGSSHNGKDTSSTQTNEGATHQSPLRAPLPVQVVEGDTEFDQIQVQDWDEEAEEDEAAAKEEELVRVQQKIERLQQEQ